MTLFMVIANALWIGFDVRFRTKSSQLTICFRIALRFVEHHPQCSLGCTMCSYYLSDRFLSEEHYYARKRNKIHASLPRAWSGPDKDPCFFEVLSKESMSLPENHSFLVFGFFRSGLFLSCSSLFLRWFAIRFYLESSDSFFFASVYRALEEHAAVKGETALNRPTTMRGKTCSAQSCPELADT